MIQLIECLIDKEHGIYEERNLENHYLKAMQIVLETFTY